LVQKKVEQCVGANPLDPSGTQGEVLYTVFSVLKSVKIKTGIYKNYSTVWGPMNKGYIYPNPFRDNVKRYPFRIP